MKPLVVVGLALLAGSASAADSESTPPWARLGEDNPDLQVLQNRKYDLTHEVALLGGSFPTNPYYKGYSASAGYTLHLNEHVAWEVGQLTYSFNADTKLKENVQRTAGFTQGVLEFPEITWVAASHFVLKPLYGKQALFNTEVVHLEVYLQTGPALVGRSGGVSPIVLGVDFGGGVRLWMTRTWSLRFEISELLYYDPAVDDGLGLYQTPHLSAGVSANLWSEE
jgi:outer membrane beta-barrel protein